MEVLITGGAGFIGYHLAKHLANKFNDITICDNLFRGKMDEDLKQLIEKNNVRFVKADLTKREELHKLEDKEYDYVYHLAAINGTNYFYEMPNKVLEVNILSLINILDWLRDTSCKRLVWPSSPETYAGTMTIANLAIPTPEAVPLSIDDIFNPRFSYAGSKIVGELLCISYARVYDLSISIVRPHNIYGPRMGYEHVIPIFIMRILKRENPFKIYGPNNSRAFCYIEDLVKGLELIATSPRTKGEIINLGNDKEEITIMKLAQKMFDLFGFHPELDILPAPRGSVIRRCPDIDKVRRLVGYEPKICLEEGLKKTFEWYKMLKSRNNLYK